MLICDTSGLIAHFNEGDPDHAAARSVLLSDPGPLVVSPFVLAELDYLLVTRHSVDTELAALSELSGGAWDLPAFEVSDLSEACAVIERYRDQTVGLTDASLVVLAKRFGTRSLLTLDHRHFSVIRPLNGGRFRLLP